MDCIACPQCGWPDKGDGCEFCRDSDNIESDAVEIQHKIAEIGRAAEKLMGGPVELLPLPCVVLQEKVTAALQEYLASIGASGETTLEVIIIHAGDEYAISRFSIETRHDEPIVRRLE